MSQPKPADNNKTMLILVGIAICCCLFSISGGLGYWYSTTKKSSSSPSPSPAPSPTPAQPATKEAKVEGCEADTLKLTCPSGKMESGSIDYGRWDNAMCLHESVNALTAPVKKSYALPAVCLGKSECDISNPNVLLGDDPYVGVYKHISAKAVCK
jgi:hypothetical protein